jgi:hypothetical protein
MHDNLTTPLALALTALLLLGISFIPARQDAPRAPQSEQSLPAWVAKLPLDNDTDRLAVLLAVRLSALALDSIVAELAETPAATPLPAPAPRRPSKSIRHLTPFYSFASAQPRTQGA